MLNEIFERLQSSPDKTSPASYLISCENSDVPLTVGDIAKNCKNINRASIYRTLLMFDNLNIINTITIGWKNYYELAEPFIPHHHHLYCINCQNAEPIQSPRTRKTHRSHR
ncbi:transcriptional repressor [Candidatus Minimicrobia vallesae]|uniref:Transcriptional repressor n=1 Tax=Candidatus Minimicrobia vallesae TaxID=2841264 RepID=A0A8F1MB54_9BACT|nr:transcriptional repressor [Candidatus Minimicrobia vallesae]